MAASNYTELTALVRTTIKDTGVDDATAQSFIRLAEAKLERDILSSNYGGQVPRQMLARHTDTIAADNSIVVPGDFIRARTVQANGIPARQVSLEAIPDPITQGFEDAAVILDYYAKIPRLNGAQTTNWVLDAAPDAYLWGACLQYVPWGRARDGQIQWEPFYADAIRTLKQVNDPRPSGNFKSQRASYGNTKWAITGSKMYFAGA